MTDAILSDISQLKTIMFVRNTGLNFFRLLIKNISRMMA